MSFPLQHVPRVLSPLRIDCTESVTTARGRSRTPSPLLAYAGKASPPPSPPAPAPARKAVDTYILAFDAQMGTLQCVPIPYEAPVVIFVASGRGTVSRTLAYFLGAAARGAMRLVAAFTERLRRG